MTFTAPLATTVGGSCMDPAVTVRRVFGFLKATDSRSKVVFKPLPQDDPRQRRPDISRARKWLNWEPRVPLAQGLRETIGYFRPRV